MKCPFCNNTIDDDSRYCDQCGKELLFCPDCKTVRKGIYCPRCGEVLIPATEYFKAPEADADNKNPGSAQAAPTPALPGLELVGSNMRLKAAEGDFGRKGGIFPELGNCPYVSSQHGSMRYFRQNNCWGICDKGSTNGTFINGTKLKSNTWYSLTPGDKLRIATLDFDVQSC